jgi:hypothetical protein
VIQCRNKRKWKQNLTIKYGVQKILGKHQEEVEIKVKLLEKSVEFVDRLFEG